MQVQWFPGHMAKTKKLIKEQLKLVDVVIELVDARIPLSSRNPLLDELIDKPRLIILNKADLADEEITKEWIDYFNNLGSAKALKFNSTIKQTLVFKKIKEALLFLTKEKRERQIKKGIKKYTIRSMVVGIPNVGKSTFINNLAGRKAAQTGNKPGITRGKQWIKLDKGMELLDTPGILWPKFDDPNVGFRLAITGAINDEVFDFREAALKLIEYLIIEYPDLLVKRYKLEESDLIKQPLEIMEKIGNKRGALLAGKKVDLTKTSHILINEFRDGKVGKITLEKPPNK